jgi:hypothetical protein
MSSTAQPPTILAPSEPHPRVQHVHKCSKPVLNLETSVGQRSVESRPHFLYPQVAKKHLEPILPPHLGMKDLNLLPSGEVSRREQVLWLVSAGYFFSLPRP